MNISNKLSIQESFALFHEKHPEVYDEFVSICLQLRKSGREHYGAGAIFEVIRYHRAIDGTSESEPFKLNNNYRSRYARMLMQEDPSFQGFFETRILRTE